MIKNLLQKFCVLVLGMSLLGSACAVETITYFHNDVVGSPLVATDASGNVVWKESYRPYGEQLQKQAASTNNKLWFAGKSYEESSGLSYSGARYYDPMLGRFLGVDPVDFKESNIHSFNRYAYGNNNPYKYIDPDGQEADLVVAWVTPMDMINMRNRRLVEGGGGNGVGGPTTSGRSPFTPEAAATESATVRQTSGSGRAGKQERLRDLANDDKLGSADRGWIKQEMNSIKRGSRKNIRNPPGKDLAHERGREAAKGYDYDRSNLQDRDLHRLQHKYDDFGRANKERPVPVAE